MTGAEFSTKLRGVTTPRELALLINELLEDSLFEEEPETLTQQLKYAARFPFSPEAKIVRGGSEQFYTHVLHYGGTDSHLDAAKVIFSSWGVPAREGESFLEELWERMVLRGSDYAVKLYLLAAAHSEEENHVRFIDKSAADLTRIHAFALDKEMIRCECCDSERHITHIIDKNSLCEVAQLEW